jgi:oligopeptide transport system substrate-binding protein
VDKDLNKKADLKVTDFLVGAEFILNYYKNGGKCASMLQSNVEGAKEYYEYTKTLTEEEALKLTYKDAFSEMVGIAADTSANTVTYTCTQPTPYFWSLGYHKCTSALAEELVDEIGVENMVGISWDKIWYTGAYVITDFIAGNTCVLSKNTTYWNYDNVTLFDTVTSNMIESTDVGFQLYQNGEIDYIYLSQSNLVNILNDPTNEYYDKVTKVYSTTSTYMMHWNYDKVDPDTGEADTNWNTAIANENFRMALYWGLDLGSYYAFKDPVTPYSIAGYTFTQSSFVNVEGMDYQDYVIELLGLEKSDDYDSRYVPDKASEYMEAAVEELTAAGVTFPIHIDNYIQSGNQSALDQATILKAAFDASFGDYIEFENKTYISSYTKEVINFRYQNYVISGWYADYSDPSNTVEQVSTTNSNNAYLDYSNALNLTEGPVYDLYQEFDELCNKARAITDLNERYKAYAEAEAFMISHNLSMPLYQNANWQLTNINDYSKALKGQSYQNWETNSEGYSTADYNTFAAEKSEG